LAEQQEAVDELMRALGEGLAELDASYRWKAEDELFDYFDAHWSTSKGARRYAVLVKVLPSLDGATLQPVLDHARAMVSQPPAGLAIDHYAYLLVGKRIDEKPRLQQELFAFNQATWSNVTGRRHKAYVAITGLDGEPPMVPGATMPIPDMVRVFRAATAPPRPHSSTTASISSTR